MSHLSRRLTLTVLSIQPDTWQILLVPSVCTALGATGDVDWEWCSDKDSQPLALRAVGALVTHPLFEARVPIDIYTAEHLRLNALLMPGEELCYVRARESAGRLYIKTTLG